MGGGGVKDRLSADEQSVVTIYVFPSLRKGYNLVINGDRIGCFCPDKIY